MKHEWKKARERVICSSQSPAGDYCTYAELTFMIDGKGNPTTRIFLTGSPHCTHWLGAIKWDSRLLQLMPTLQKLVHDFSVYPFEGGVWKSRVMIFYKRRTEYTTAIRQPDFITESIYG